jgi:hypothetical protein
MPKALSLAVASILLLCIGAGMSTTHHVNNPLLATHLLALVAGNSLPENIVAAIESRGLAF